MKLTKKPSVHISKYMDPDAWESLNPAERAAFDTVLAQWDIATPFRRDTLLGCLFGQVQGKINAGYTIWLGIESDGHTHS